MRRTRWLGGALSAFGAFVLACASVTACGSDDSATGGGGDQDAEQPAIDAGRDTGKRDSAPPLLDAGVDSPEPMDAAPPFDSGDAGQKDGGIVMAHNTGHSLMSGGVVSHSRNFVAVRSLAQSPGGNDTESSRSFRFYGGLVGATQ